MIKMKEITTPFKLVGISYYIDEDGLYYKRFGRNHLHRVIPIWKKKLFNLGVPLLLLTFAIGFTSYKLSTNILSKKKATEISNQISKKEIQTLLADPDLQQTIENDVGPSIRQKILKKYSVTLEGDSMDHSKGNNSYHASAKSNNDSTSIKTKSPIKFTSEEEVRTFLLSKFSLSELLGFSEKVKSAATPKEKAEIKQVLMERLTPEEYKALKVFAIVELSK